MHYASILMKFARTITFIYFCYAKPNSKAPVKHNIVDNGLEVLDVLNKTNHPKALCRKNFTTAVMSDPAKSFVVVYAGAVARMCCTSKTGGNVTWTYAKSVKNSTYTRVVQRDRVVIQNGSISIYRATMADTGLYRCRTDEDIRKLIILEVITDDLYTVTSDDTEASTNSTELIGEGLTVFTSWSDWSECSTCGKQGIRRRYGMCYVQLNSVSRGSHKQNKRQNGDASSRYFTLLQAFPNGIPCRSRYLPVEIRHLPFLKKRNNEIIITPCKILCQVKIFELRSPTGVLLEAANNSAGIYSLSQPLPPQPPAAVRNILFVARGQRLQIICPGTTLRDIPVTWRVGTNTVDPEVLVESSAGRVHADACDIIVIAHVLYEDSNLYSCWEDDNLAGTVKLVVWAGGQARWNHHSVLVVLAILGVVLLHISVHMLQG